MLFGALFCNRNWNWQVRRVLFVVFCCMYVICYLRRWNEESEFELRLFCLCVCVSACLFVYLIECLLFCLMSFGVLYWQAWQI